MSVRTTPAGLSDWVDTDSVVCGTVTISAPRVRFRSGRGNIARPGPHSPILAQCRSRSPCPGPLPGQPGGDGAHCLVGVPDRLGDAAGDLSEGMRLGDAGLLRLPPPGADLPGHDHARDRPVAGR